MTAARKIPEIVRKAQIEAADPAVSAFVSANAGAGKTHVLAQRVINLLLDGCDPAKILCITFTKAAAANMANRVFGTLSQWTALDDAALDQEIGLAGRRPNAVLRARARRLFTSALETPGGLKVQTIHAFCTRLLHQFPFEANVAARFTVLDDAATAQLLDQFTLDVLLAASADGASAVGRALKTTIVAAADQTFKDVIGEAFVERDTLSAWIDYAGGVDAAMAQLSQDFGLDPNDTLESVEREFFEASLIPESEWPVLIELLESGSASDKKHIAALDATRAASSRERIEQYRKIFCTSELEPRKNLVTKKVAQRHPDWLQRLVAEQTRVCGLIERERALAARERTRALVTIIKSVIDRYRAEKERRALLDYDDLIDKALQLFSRASAAWVLYKLDLGIDHLLIDEAQDTSPKQWEIIRTIGSEFVPGGSRPEIKRTVFAVGDEKQSIFSFQGAEPRAFYDSRKYFEKLYRDAELEFIEKKFDFSFRSSEIILSAVDKVYSRPEAFEGLTADPTKTVHQALPDAAPGLVELWPLIEPSTKRAIEGWDAPFDTESEESPRVQLARRIAAHVKGWSARGLKPGNVLVLVRQRGTLFEAIIRALKNAGLPVAGADRLTLTEHIAVMDLMALTDALLLPEDDLALANVLRSPLFGMSDAHLFELAFDRKGSLRASLRAKAGAKELFAATDNALDDLAQAAHEHTPFGFFAHVLGPQRGRKKILARLGPEASDALDEFLNLALDYETRETPSLQGFLAFLRAARSEVRRDMEIARDEVRVMTVHGAKGLEANTVILADTTTPPAGHYPPKLLALDDGALVWAGRKENDVKVMARARETMRNAARDEYRRLLYVAMTRAAERLIVCGAKGEKKIPDGCWYQLVNDALSSDCVAEPAEDAEGEVLRYRKFAAVPEEAIVAFAPANVQPSLPVWLTRNAPTEAPAPRTVTPSSAVEEEARPNYGAAAGEARLRGTLTHRLLQSLPDVPPAHRAKAARTYLARTGTKLSPEEREHIAEQVMFVLEDQRFYELFAPGSQAEVPIVGRIDLSGETVHVSGQVDRLAVAQDSVLIGDFKTNWPVPRRIEEVPQRYLSQLALYRTLLMRLYPGRTVRCALIWTEVPELMELSAETLKTALPRITPA